MNKKRLIIAAAVIAAAVILIFNLKIETADEHYAKSAEKSDIIGSVTLLVSCEEIGDKMLKSGVVPEDGIIIPEAKYPISDGDTAFSVLKEALDEKKLHFDYTEISGSSVYVRGICNIYEYDCGDLSGWMYSVNGDFPTIAASEYTLHDGDSVRWLYTCDLGRDVGDTYYTK